MKLGYVASLAIAPFAALGILPVVAQARLSVNSSDPLPATAGATTGTLTVPSARA
jgi:hypothetical protein